MAFHQSLAAVPLCLGLLLACGGPESDLSEPNPVATVSLHPKTATLEPGQTLALSPTLRDADGFTVTGRDLQWESSNPPVATVASGLVTAVEDGSAVISASVDGSTATARVIVQRAVSSIVIEPGSPSVATGTSVQLNATLLGAGGSEVEGPVVSWLSSNPRVASVNVGKVRGLRVGISEITAIADGRSATTTATVLPNVSGPWTVTVSLTDSARDLTCSATESLVLQQSGGTLGGTLDRAGSCRSDGAVTAYAGSFEMRDAGLSISGLDFLIPGSPGCTYAGSFVLTPPITAGGGVICSGEIAGAPATLRGTWEMRR